MNNTAPLEALLPAATRQPIIMLRREAFDCGFDVLVLFSEAHGTTLNHEFRSLREARGYAAGLAAATGFALRIDPELVDESQAA